MSDGKVSPSAQEGAEDDLTGRRVGEFQVVRLIGQGGMGQVYLAEQVSLKRKVALKILKPDLAASDTALKRFRAEAEAVARVTHANIVQVYAIGDLDGLPYMALEYVEGRNLRDYLAKKGPPELPLALSIMRQVAAALGRAGEFGIVHRDIKPDNILLTRKGEVKVADFGLSRCFGGEKTGMSLTQSGVTLGTPLYMSPEQVQGQPIDPRSDLYSFGVTCYHLLSGNPPFREGTALDVAMQHVQSDPILLHDIRPDLPVELCDLVHRMMAKSPAQRPQSAREVLRELTRLRDAMLPPSGVSTPVAATTETPIRAATRSGPTPVRRPRWRWSLTVGAATLALLAGGAVGLLAPADKRPNATPGVDESRQPLIGEREKYLVQSFHADKNLTREHIEAILPQRVELGVLYLRQGRFDEARDYFQKLERLDKAPPLVLLGKLGRAILRAYSGDPSEAAQSVTEFVALLGGSVREKPAPAKGPTDRAFLLVQKFPELHAFVDEALYRDEQALKGNQPFPKELDYLRRPTLAKVVGKPAE